MSSSPFLKLNVVEQGWNCNEKKVSIKISEPSRFSLLAFVALIIKYLWMLTQNKYFPLYDEEYFTMCALYCSPCIFTSSCNFLLFLNCKNFSRGTFENTISARALHAHQMQHITPNYLFPFCAVNVQNKNLINGNFHNLHFLLVAC